MGPTRTTEGGSSRKRNFIFVFFFSEWGGEGQDCRSTVTRRQRGRNISSQQCTGASSDTTSGCRVGAEDCEYMIIEVSSIESYTLYSIEHVPYAM